MAESEGKKYGSMAEKLMPLLAGLGMGGDQRPVDGTITFIDTESSSDIKMPPNESANLSEADQLLIQEFAKRPDLQEVRMKPVSPLDIMNRLRENPGGFLVLHTPDRMTEYEVWYDENQKKFAKKILKGVNVQNKQSFFQSKEGFGGFLKNNGLQEKREPAKNAPKNKIVFDAAGDQVRPEPEDTKEAPSVASNTAANIETPVAMADVKKVFQKEKKTATIAEPDSSEAKATKEPVSAVVEEKEVALFAPKSHELQALLEEKTLARRKRNPEERKQLADDIRKAAQKVIDGGDIAQVIASFGLDTVKVSKTLQSIILAALTAELAAHRSQEPVGKVSEEAIDSTISNDVVVEDEKNVQSDPQETTGVTPDKDSTVSVASEENPSSIEGKKDALVEEHGTDVLKNRIFGEDWDKKKAQRDLIENENRGQAVVDLKKNEEKIVLDERLFGKELSLEEQRLMDAHSEKIDALETRLIAARQEYALMDYKKTTARDNVRRFFGKNLFKDIDEDVLVMKNAYQETLMEYTNARLEQARLMSASQEELKINLVSVLREIELQEPVSLYDARVNAKMPNWLVEKTQGMVDWYRGLSFQERLAYSAIMIAGGAALGVTVGAGAASLAFLARRGFGGAVAGRGVFQFGETLSQQAFQEKSDTRIRDAQKEMAFTESSEDMIRQIQERVSFDKEKIDIKLNSMMKNRSRSTVAGFATGAFLGFGAPQYLMEKFQAGFMPESSAITSSIPVEQTPLAPVTEAVVEHAEQPIKLAIHAGTGESIEGQLIKYLTENGHAEDAGVKAHMLVVNYLDEHGGSIEQLNKILSGSVELSPDSLHIQSIETVPMRQMAEHAADIHSKIIPSPVDIAASVREVSATVPADLPVIDESAMNQQPTDVFGSPKIAEGTADMTNLQGESTINRYTGALEINGTEATPEQNAEIIRLATPKGIMGELAGGKRRMWLDIKGLTLSQIRDDQSGKYDKVLGVMAKYTKALGENMPNMKPTDTLLWWVSRVAKAVKP